MIVWYDMAYPINIKRPNTLLKEWQMLPKLTKDDLGDKVPRRQGKLTQKLAAIIYKKSGWTTVGSVPNISQAVLLAVPHTSNIDGLYAIPMLLDLDIDIKIMGKKELFALPVFSHFLHWAGVIPIDRSKKGSVLEASIERFKTGKPLFLALAPEGTREYTESWKTGFYYLAMGAGVPIIPVAMDYTSRQIRFLSPFYPTGDIEKDLPKIYAYYQGVSGKYPEKMSKPLQDLNK